MVKKRFTLGFQINELDSGYTSKILDGVNKFTQNNDCNLLVFPGRSLDIPYDSDYQNNVIYEYISQNNVDALIMLSSILCNFVSMDELPKFHKRIKGIPIISIGIELEGIPSIVIDNRKGLYDEISHLIEDHGRRRIAFITGPDNNPEAQLRLDTYKKALTDHDLPVDQSIIFPGDFTPGGAEIIVNNLIRSNKIKFDALVGANDDSGIKAAEILMDHGFHIPSDIAVAGFDNIEKAQFMIPTFTTVEQPLMEEGMKAAEIALAMLNNGKVPLITTLPTKMIKRSSCGCLPSSLSYSDDDFIYQKENTSANLSSKVFSSSALVIQRAVESLKIPDFEKKNHIKRLTPLLEDLVKILIKDHFTEIAANRFVIKFNQILENEVKSGNTVLIWQEIIKIFHNELLSLNPDRQETDFIEKLLLKSRVILNEIFVLQETSIRYEFKEKLYTIRDISKRLINILDEDELIEKLYRIFPELSIHCCYISKYNKVIVHKRYDSWKMPNKASLILAYKDAKQLEISPKNRYFSPKISLIPRTFFPHDRSYTFNVVPLFHNDDHFGIIIFEIGNAVGVIYETFTLQISSVFKSIHLFNERKKTEEKLKKVFMELEEYNRRLNNLSQTDELTGLYNRRGFISMAQQNLDLALRMGKSGLIYFADLDGLKKINDTYGHIEGDFAIIKASEVLKATFRHVDIIARLGGDEFTVFTMDLNLDFMGVIKKRLEKNIIECNRNINKPYKISISIGAVKYSDKENNSLEILLDKADQILYEEKKKKKKPQEKNEV